MSISPILVGKQCSEVLLLPSMASRHGVIAGATGTGKTVTLKVLAEGFSKIGVPVFLADVKGDIAGIAQPGSSSEKLRDRCTTLGIAEPAYAGFPVTFWDVFGAAGHPVRTTVSEMGPLLFSRLLNVNETQAGVLQIVFKVADDNGLLLLDLKDLKSLLQHVGEHAGEYRTQYGNVSAASIGAIQRGVLALEEAGGDRFFGEPALSIEDLIQTNPQGLGIINILAAERLMQNPVIYSTFLLWLLSELFENLPEAGDQEKPKLVFFFDEAHLLFHDAPAALQQKIEQVVRLVRSKGVGIYFVSQNASDIPDAVLGQLGNRIQHALRAFTPKDQKAIRASAETFRAREGLDIQSAITELGIGEALVSLLDEKGMPCPTERVWIVPPASRMGPVSQAERTQHMAKSLVQGVYEKTVDQESAYEVLSKRVGASGSAAGKTKISIGGFLSAMVNSTARTIGNQVGRALIRGVMGSLLGRGSSRR